MTVRKIVFWMHLTAGVFAGTVVLIMSVTGVALTYQKQMTAWADRAFWPPAAPHDVEPLPLDILISRVVQARPEARPAEVIIAADRSAPVLVTAASGPNLFVNRYTGEIRELGTSPTREFFRHMTTWHRYIGGTGDNRTIGKAITGASNLAFLFIVVTGCYLWWPRTWTLRSVRAVTWFKGGLSGRPRDFNWHNVFGFWTAIPLFIVVLSATVISYPWASNLAYRIAGDDPPVRAGRATRTGQTGAEEGETRALDLNQLKQLPSRATEQDPEWQTINVRLPTTQDQQVTVTVDGGYRGQPQLRSTLVFDKATAEVQTLTTFSDQSAGQRLRSWLRFVHTGEFYGVGGQTVAGVASLSAVMLVFTGLSLSIRRFLAWIGRR